MKLVWTKSSLPLSILIRWGLKEPCSHFAIVFDADESDDKGIIFESNLLGTHIKWYPTYKKHCQVVHEVRIKMPLRQEEAIYQSILNRYDDKNYDYRAFAYFAWRAILFRLFKKPFPQKNAWGSGNSFICVGLAQALKDESGQLPPNIKKALDQIPDLEMVSPEQLYQRIQEAIK